MSATRGRAALGLAGARAVLARRLAVLSVAALGALSNSPTRAWGDEGHEVIAIIAAHDLEPKVLEKVEALLQGDGSGLTSRDLAHEATWADHYRDSDRDGARVRYQATRAWHFVDLELRHPDLTLACHGRPRIAPGLPASRGPAEDCVVDKIDQFQLELATRTTPPEERRLALQFLLHFVGDLHQPLHASDDHDQGGNLKHTSGAGLRPGNLHRDWDADFVERLGSGADEIAARLIERVTAADRLRWRSGTPEQWAFETYGISRAEAYGALPTADARHRYLLSAQYVDQAMGVTAQQLEKAGVRLAWLLNQALHREE
jgi:hypothetical protein